MADKPIIFSAAMVNALLSGRKTQTRRVLNPQPDHRDREFIGFYAPGLSAVFEDADGVLADQSIRLKYNRGDRLWVREAHALVGTVDPQWVLYRASGYEAECERHGFDSAPDESTVRWRPSIHMPRWASRLTLTITDVRVQRVQEISEGDAWAEGCKRGLLNDHGEPFPAEEPHPKGGFVGWECSREWFADLWDSIHGPDAWDRNPWVAAYTFTVEQRNIDQ